MSAVALLIPIILVLLANVAIYVGLFLLARRGMRRLLPSMVGLWHNGAAAVLVVIVVVGVPTAYNAFYRHERQALVSGDIAWTGSLTHTKTLAILTDAPEDPNWYDRKECGPLRCRALLYHHAVDAVLVAFPPPIGDRLNAAMRVTRYRLDHRTWCPPIEHMDERRHGRNLDQLAAAAAGECLISEPATLGDADVIVLDQTFAPRRIALDIPTEGVTGERIAIYVRAGDRWREVYRKTSIGGADWSIPLRVGIPNRDRFGLLMFGGGEPGFMTAHMTGAAPLSVAQTMAEHGLGEHDGAVPTEADMAALARRLLADPTIPHASAAMQFLASYPWLGGWRRNDLGTIAAIIRDQRVTDFPHVPWQDETPAELAQPIIDRILASDVSGAPSATECGQRCALRVLGEVFSLLPAGAAAAQYNQLLRLAEDRTRRPYVAAMFWRLADAGPRSFDVFERLIRDGLQEGHAAANKTSWALGDGCMVPISLYGLTRLGEAAKPARNMALAAATDDLGKFFCNNQLRDAAELALLHLGDLDALRSVRPAGDDFFLQQLDKGSVSQIGQCGSVFPHSSYECHVATSH
jgi:hypothetical protein